MAALLPTMSFMVTGLNCGGGSGFVLQTTLFEVSTGFAGAGFVASGFWGGAEVWPDGCGHVFGFVFRS